MTDEVVEMLNKMYADNFVFHLAFLALFFLFILMFGIKDMSGK